MGHILMSGKKQERGYTIPPKPKPPISEK